MDEDQKEEALNALDDIIDAIDSAIVDHEFKPETEELLKQARGLLNKAQRSI